jgi:hypothetical protein
MRLGGVSVYGTYYRDKGQIYNLMGFGLQKIGITTHSAELLRDNFRSRIHEMGGIDGGGRIFHLCHSQGAQITQCMKTCNLLSQSERQMIHVNTFGGAYMINSDDFGRASNFVSNRDWVSHLAAPLGTINGLLGRQDNIQFLNTNNVTLWDHGWDNEVYQTPINWICDNLKIKYGTH